MVKSIYKQLFSSRCEAEYVLVSRSQTADVSMQKWRGGSGLRPTWDLAVYGHMWSRAHGRRGIYTEQSSVQQYHSLEVGLAWHHQTHFQTSILLRPAHCATYAWFQVACPIMEKQSIDRSDQSNSPYLVMIWYSLHLIGQFGSSFFRDGTSNLKWTAKWLEGAKASSG